LTASYNPLTVATSTSVTITAFTASKLTFSVQPANAQAGQTLGSIQVSVLDVFNNVATSANGTSVTLALTGSPAGVTLGGTLSAVVTSGVATFTGLNIDK